MEERIEALEQIQRTSFEAQKHMLEAIDGLQKQITSLFKISRLRCPSAPTIPCCSRPTSARGQRRSPGGTDDGWS
jgi:hypothetical protein